MADNSQLSLKYPEILSSDPEVVRRAFLDDEVSIRALGTLHIILAGWRVPYIFINFVNAPAGTKQIVSLAVASAWNAACIGVGLSLRKLDPKIKIPVIILSVLGFLAGISGVILGIAGLYLILSKRKAFVFTARYHEVVAATPQIKYVTRLLIWIAIALIIVLLSPLIMVGIKSPR